MQFITLLVVGGLIAAGIWYRIHSAHRSWRAVADDLGLVYHPGGFLEQFGMAGSLRGVDLRVSTVSRRTHDGNETHTVFRATLPDRFPDSLAVGTPSLIDEVDSLLTGGEEIDVGDGAFDERFDVQVGEDASAATIFEQEDVRRAFLDLGSAADEIRITDGEAVLEEGYFVTDAEPLRERLEVLSVFCADLRTALGDRDDSAEDDAFSVNW